MSAAVSAPTAAVETATTTEVATATMETAAPAEAVSTMIGARTATEVAVAAVGWSAISAAVTVAGPAVVARTTVEVVIPRASSDEYPSGEPARAVVTVGRASVRVIPIIAVRADRGGTHILRADSEADDNALGMRVRRNHQAETEQRKYFQVFHVWTPSEIHDS